MNFKAMFEDQQAFNRLVWDRERFKGNEPAMMERLRVLGLGLVEETLEFLRTFEYKVHRRSKLRLQNVAHSHEEMIDQFKYWLSLADLVDFPLDKLEEMYYAKSRVVRYRYQEEWVKSVTGPSVIVDIDQVLADYVSGICRWGRQYGPQLMKLSNSDTIRLTTTLADIEARGGWVNHETVGVSHMQWQQVKHDFRMRGGKRLLSVFSDAKPFLEWCRSNEWTIILVTARPINEYPNIFTDTLTWLHANDLPFDHVWWASEKGERLEEAHIVMRSQIVFAVDDSERYVNQFRSKGIKTYWLDRTATTDSTAHDPMRVHSLHDLMARHAREHVGVESHR
jgi:FMN phosphatase YigB (HAD superfamily)